MLKLLCAWSLWTNRRHGAEFFWLIEKVQVSTLMLSWRSHLWDSLMTLQWINKFFHHCKWFHAPELLSQLTAHCPCGDKPHLECLDCLIRTGWFKVKPFLDHFVPTRIPRNVNREFLTEQHPWGAAKPGSSCSGWIGEGVEPFIPSLMEVDNWAGHSRALQLLNLLWCWIPCAARAWFKITCVDLIMTHLHVFNFCDKAWSY